MSRKERDYKCYSCDKTFCLKSSLKIHELKHKKVREKYERKEDHILDVLEAESEIANRDVKCDVKYQKTRKLDNDKYAVHVCTICCKTFSSKKSLNCHTKKHELRENLKCDTCERTFASQKTFSKHALERNSCKPKCLVCKKIFPTPDMLKKHTEEDSYKCFFCHESFQSCESAKDHSQSHLLECKLCPEKFSCKNDLKLHKLNHQGDLSCSVCKRTFLTQLNLRRHVRRLHIMKINIQCQECGKVFDRKGFVLHMRTHTGERPYKCEDCGFCFVQRYHLVRHMKSHSCVKDFQCDVCGRTFFTKANLALHSFTHTGEKPYKCEMCQRKFAQKTTLKQHMKAHAGNEHHSCKICGKQYSYNYLFYKHYRFHSQEELKNLDTETLNSIWKPKNKLKKLYCNLCKKGFIFESEFEVHMRLHTGEKPYKCSICEKAFRLKHNLKNHQIIHTGEKPFQCNVCDKSFARLANAKAHMVIHTGEKPYSCKVCGKAFSRENHLITHRKIHSKNPCESSPGKQNHITCTCCGEAFTELSVYTSHQNICSFKREIVEMEERSFVSNNSGSDLVGELSSMRNTEDVPSIEYLSDSLLEFDTLPLKSHIILSLSDAAVDDKENIIVSNVEESDHNPIVSKIKTDS